MGRHPTRPRKFEREIEHHRRLYEHRELSRVTDNWIFYWRFLAHLQDRDYRPRTVQRYHRMLRPTPRPARRLAPSSKRTASCCSVPRAAPHLGPASRGRSSATRRRLRGPDSPVPRRASAADERTGRRGLPDRSVHSGHGYRGQRHVPAAVPRPARPGFLTGIVAVWCAGEASRASRLKP